MELKLNLLNYNPWLTPPKTLSNQSTKKAFDGVVLLFHLNDPKVLKEVKSYL
jgi:hypothetical protein